MTAKQVDAATDVFLFDYCEVLQHGHLFLHFVGYIAENNYSMNTYVLLLFGHKNEATIIIKLHRASYLEHVAPYRSWK